jgi:flavin-dependent dehydrogenase
MTYDVIVIGGGLAVCSAASQLARDGFRVLLLEKGRYPVHKLCGEFLSVEVQSAFERLGVWSSVLAAGARPIRRTFVTTMDGASFEEDLPGVAWGLSRYRLDPLLFEHAVHSGAEGYEGQEVRSVEGSLETGYSVKTEAATYAARIVLGAYGKRGRLDGTLGRQFLDEKSPYVAFKAHFEGMDFPDVVELHAFSGGYCGLSPVEEGRVNACWISHERVLKAAGGRAEAMVEQAFAANPVLAERFGKLHRVSDGYKAVSQVGFRMKQPFEGDVCMLGDAAGTIAPLCGDGMAMAFQSAEIAVPLAAGFLRDSCAASEFRDRYARAWERAFKSRIRLGRLVHYGYVHPLVAAAGVRVLAAVPGLPGWLIKKTRGTSTAAAF